MAFTVHRDPHHVNHPTLGWLTPEHLDPEHPDHPSDVFENLQGDNLRTHGGPPEAEHPHHVEVDLSTGWEGYTRLDEAEIAEMEANAERVAAEDRAREEAREQDLTAIRRRAKEDSEFAALARLLGLPLD